jgi:hypothetical protein
VSGNEDCVRVEGLGKTGAEFAYVQALMNFTPYDELQRLRDAVLAERKIPKPARLYRCPGCGSTLSPCECGTPHV